MTRTSGTLKSAAVLLLIVVAVLVIAVSLKGGMPGGVSLFGQQIPTPQPGSGSGSPHAKNVIVLIGDGMGYAELTAARWEKSGHDLKAYPSTSLAMDDLEYSGRVSTSAADAPRSGFGGIGDRALYRGQGQQRRDRPGRDRGEGGLGRSSSHDHRGAGGDGRTGDGRGHDLQDHRRDPGGVYAHVNDRNAEPAIAQQLLGSGVDVALGGGYRYFISETAKDPWGEKGKRTDAQDLAAEAQSKGYTVVTDVLRARRSPPRTPGTTVLGLFDTSTMAYELKARGLRATEPLRDDREGDALLGTDQDGFFLMVEGGTDRPGSERSRF